MFMSVVVSGDLGFPFRFLLTLCSIGLPLRRGQRREIKALLSLPRESAASKTNNN